MKVIKIPVKKMSTDNRIGYLRKDIEEKLFEFCINKVRQAKLSTSSFNYKFELRGLYSSTEQKKSLQKIKELLYKSVKKQIPYLDYVKGNLSNNLLDDSITGTTRINGMVTSPYFLATYRPGLSVDFESENSKWTKSLAKYFRYLNRQCAKHGLSLRLSPEFIAEVHPDDATKLNDHILQETVIEPINMQYRLRVNCKFTIRLCALYCRPYREFIDREENRHIKTIEDYSEHLNANRTPSGRIDVYDPDSWTYENFRRANWAPGVEKYMTPEKLFFHLDKLQKVIKTLARTTTYDTAAFTIGN